MTDPTEPVQLEWLQVLASSALDWMAHVLEATDSSSTHALQRLANLDDTAARSMLLVSLLWTATLLEESDSQTGETRNIIDRMRTEFRAVLALDDTEATW